MHETREITFDSSTPVIVASVQTDPGCVREANEDSGRHVSPNDAETRRSRGTLTIVADGMGGHASGEIASQMAVDLISEFYYTADAATCTPEALSDAIRQANAAIYETSLTDEKYYGMGTTVIALALLGDRAFAAHVGDSRLYRYRRDTGLQMLTIDHSQVMEMVRHGIITIEQARSHDDKNVILRAVGTQPEVEVEITGPFDVAVGDTFLLCSDGLTDMVEDQAIEAVLAEENDIHTASERLISAARLNGGHDNITAGLVRVASETLAEASRDVRITREIAIEEKQ
ncbi:MAG: Stp1/IreP family PP2C-type Ser/Thr phosphatase [Pyrinomonadaceae bacterium]